MGTRQETLRVDDPAEVGLAGGSLKLLGYGSTGAVKFFGKES